MRDQRAFQNCYQPQYRLSDGHLAGFEVLSRWHHPELGTLSPAIYIHLARRLNLLTYLDSGLLLRAREVEQFNLHEQSLSLSINAAPETLLDDEHLDCLLQAATSMPAGFQLEVEITEDSLIPDDQILMARLEQLRECGIRLALDDFGSGYSNLAYLASFPFDRIKLDRSLIAGIETCHRKRQLALSALSMALELSYEVVAEGIETETQLHLLRESGCHYGQGYYLGRPLPASVLVEKGFRKVFVALPEISRPMQFEDTGAQLDPVVPPERIDSGQTQA
jgi:EAL domain-containing protein (putative c-di-GMP-specific phosphodiesterase class I)